MKNRVLRDYAGRTDTQLGDFALHIATSMTGNANFTTPPVTPAALTTQATAFNTAVANAINGTQSDTLDKQDKRTALIATLDQLAVYVELTANGDAAKILSSGFNLNSGHRNPAAVPSGTNITDIENVASGQLALTIPTAANAWAYLVEYTAVPNGAKLTATFTNPNNVTLTGLTSGTMYSLRVMTMGSGNQTTPWSDPVQHMAT